MVRFLPGSKYFKYTTEQLKNHIEAGTVEKTILASDLGVKGAAMPVEGMRRTIELCLDLGYSADAVRAMIRDNPNRLLGVAQ
jgi:hypothetical protein